MVVASGLLKIEEQWTDVCMSVLSHCLVLEGIRPSDFCLTAWSVMAPPSIQWVKRFGLGLAWSWPRALAKANSKLICLISLCIERG